MRSPCASSAPARTRASARVAVYADPDRDALFVRLADEAHSLGGSTPAESYLDIAKIIAVAQKTGADSVHPGYGFLAENAEFAQAVIDAGLIWIGPPPAAIEALGDKAKAKHIADKANAPLAPGTKDPVKDADEVVEFAEGERAAGRHQGGLRRRRPRPQGRPHARGDPRRLRVGGPRGGHRVRPRRVPRREVPRQAAPRRDPVPRRPARQRRRRLHPRLLAPAPQPEARRGGARAVPHRRRRPTELYESSKAHPARGRLLRRRHLRVPGRPGRHHLLPRGQHPAPGRALRLRGGHRDRPGPRDVPDRRRRGARLRRPGDPRPLDRVPHQRRGRRPQLHARPRHPLRVEPAAAARASASTAATRTARPSPARSTR